MNMHHEFDTTHILRSAHQERVIVAHDHDPAAKEKPAQLVEEIASAMASNAHLPPASNNGAGDEGLVTAHALHFTPQLFEFEPAESFILSSPSLASEEELPAEQTPNLTPQLLEFEPAENFVPPSPGATFEGESPAHAPHLARRFPELETNEIFVPANLGPAASEEMPAEQAHILAPQPSEVAEEKKRARQNKREDKEALKKKPREAEEKMNRLAQALEREKLETERQRRYYESRLRELEQRFAETSAVPQAKAADEETEPENIASPKATFRIDLYAHQGEFQGKIEHMLTHEKRAFKGLDQAAISEFMAAHLPHVEAKVEELQKIVALQGHDESKLEAPANMTSTSQATSQEEEKLQNIMPLEVREASTPEARAAMPSAPAKISIASAGPMPIPVRVRGLNILFAATRTRANMLPYGQAFDLELELERIQRSEPEQTSWTCQVALFAKRIEGGARQSLGEATRQLAAGENPLPFRVSCVQLPRGTYRLEALVNVHSGEAVFSMTTKKLIQVY